MPAGLLASVSVSKEVGALAGKFGAFAGPESSVLMSELDSFFAKV